MQIQNRPIKMFSFIVALTLILGFISLPLQAATKAGYLGVQIKELTPTLKEKYQVGAEKGLLIIDVIDCGPADKANLFEDDIILKFDGKGYEKVEPFVEAVKAVKPGTEVPVEILRDGETKKLKVVIGQRKEKALQKFNKMMFIKKGPQLGVKIHKLDEDLATYFKVKANEGVLVLHVLPESPAEKGGLKPGDVIVKVGDTKITDPPSLVESVKDLDEGDKVTLEYVRAGKKSQTEVELAAMKPHEDFIFKSDVGKQFHIKTSGNEERKMIKIFGPDVEEELEILHEEMQAADEITI